MMPLSGQLGQAQLGMAQLGNVSQNQPIPPPVPIPVVQFLDSSNVRVIILPDFLKMAGWKL
jgi:hypothetical protein